jgi:hypothetical protein
VGVNTVWNKTGLRWFVGLLASVLLSGVSWGQSLQSGNPQIVVAVYDDAEVPLNVVMRAEERATRVFQVAKIDVIWRNPAVAGEPGSRQARVEIDSQQLSVRIVPRSRNLGDDIFGMAFLDENGRGRQADVFYSRIARLSKDAGYDPATVLAAVMVHELGHLLLGSNSHSPMGIMRKRWDQDQLRLAALCELNFDADQSLKIRERLANADGKWILQAKAGN